MILYCFLDTISFLGHLNYDKKSQRTLQYAVNITFLCLWSSDKDPYTLFQQIEIEMIDDAETVVSDTWGWNYSVTGIVIHLDRYKAPFILQVIP